MTLVLQFHEYNVTSFNLLDCWLSFARYLLSLFSLVTPEGHCDVARTQVPVLHGPQDSGFLQRPREVVLVRR